MRYVMLIALFLAPAAFAQTATMNCTATSPTSIWCASQTRQPNTVYPALQAHSAMDAFYEAQRNARANERVEIERQRIESEARYAQPARQPAYVDQVLADKVIARMKVCLDASAGNAEASRDCIARRYRSDPEFARGFDVMLSDADDRKGAMDIRVDLEKRLAAMNGTQEKRQ